jgi:hypothetical protein
MQPDVSLVDNGFQWKRQNNRANKYNYTECTLSYIREKDDRKKLAKYLLITRIIKQFLKPLKSPEAKEARNTQHISNSYHTIRQ